MSLFIEVHSVKVHVTDSVRLFSSELLNLIACCSLTGVPIVLYLCILSHFLPRSDSLSSPPFFVDRLCSPPSVSLASFDLQKFKPIVQEEIKKCGIIQHFRLILSTEISMKWQNRRAEQLSEDGESLPFLLQTSACHIQTME